MPRILLGLICEGESTAAKVLINFGAGLDRVRQQVIQPVSNDSATPDAP